MTAPSIRIIQVNAQTDNINTIFSQSIITFGRNPSCDVVFPSDCLIVSRLHAMISQHGNHYILKNLSANACYVDNIKTEECILKQSGFITFADGGPVVSYTLTGKTAQKHSPALLSQAKTTQPRPVAEPPTLLTKAGADFTFQYGTCIKSFHQNSVIVGKGPCCDFAIEHTTVQKKQFQIYFRNNDYILKDLSDTHSTLVNNAKFDGEIQLKTGDILTLNSSEIRLKFWGDGRISEYNPQKYAETPSPDNLHSNLLHSSLKPKEQNQTNLSVFDIFKAPHKKH